MAIYIKQLINYLEREEYTRNLFFEFNNQEKKLIEDTLRERKIDFKIYKHRKGFSKLLVRMS